jgi:flagellar protein FliJ
LIVFQFRLQRVLELREQREQETAARLSEARDEAGAAREAQSALELLRSESIERLTAAHSGGAPAGQLQNVSYMLEHLNRQISQAQSLAEAADETVRRLVEEYTAAFQDRRVLDRLRDRQHGEWKTGEQAADRQVMDGVALNGYARRNPPASQGS